MRALQCVAEASGGHEWVNTYPHPMVCTADLVKAFMMATEVQHEARDIARCWGKPPDSCPAQPRVQEFAQVTALLDSMAARVPSQRAFDELIYPPYEPHNHHSYRYMVRGVMDLEESMPLTEVAVYDNDCLLSQGCGLLFKGWVLVYDPQNDHAKWVQFRGSASDLSDAEIASAEELVVYVPSEAMRGVARLDHLAEKQMETSPMNVAGKDPIDTSDSEEFLLEEDPELADDLCNVILDERGEDQPCPVGTAVNPVMDPQVEAVASTPSSDDAALPTEEALGEPTFPSSNPTETLETQDLGAEDTVVLLHEEEMTDFC